MLYGNDFIKEKCTGCGSCVNICPNDAITMEQDNEGFLYPKMHEEKCTKCGLCEKVCYISTERQLEPKSNNNVKVYAAWTLNEEVRYNSTSGGIFSELARLVINKSGFVCGARYTEDFLVKHDIIAFEDSIKELRQSKYIQSDIGLIYRKIKNKLIENKVVLFVGTPCQVVGLKNFLGRDYENLILCDFICRGINSPKAYIKYLESLEEKYNSKVKKVWFKNKKNGWNKFCTQIEFENGEIYSKDRYEDLFMRGYLKYNLFMRPVCSNCSCKDVPKKSDITLADYWGVKLKDKSQNIENGTSLVIVNSEKGKRCINEIKDNIFIEESNLKEALSFNQCAINSINHGKYREYFFKKINYVKYDELIFDIIKKRGKENE